MKIYIALIILSFAYTAQASSVIRIELGKTFTIPASGTQLTLEQFKHYKPECAVPGYNCGAGYDPTPFTSPIIAIKEGPKCQNYPLGAECEITFKVEKTDNKSFVEIVLLNVFEVCEKDPNKDNRNSCLLGVAKNRYDKPAFRAENCERIEDAPETKDACYEGVADKAQDAKVCELIKGEQRFQCILLRAKVNRDPEICKTLKKNRFHHTEQDLKDQIQACLNTTPKG